MSAVAEPSFNCIDDARAAGQQYIRNTHKTRWIVFHYPFSHSVNSTRVSPAPGCVVGCPALASPPTIAVVIHTHNGAEGYDIHNAPFVIRADGGRLGCLHEKLMSNDHPVLFVFVSVDVLAFPPCITTTTTTAPCLPLMFCLNL